MNRRYLCNCGDVSMVLIASLGLSLGFAGESFGQCSNDAGAGDVSEAEACPLDENDDTTNGGCNSTPPVFTSVPSLPTTFCSSAANHNNTRTCAVDDDCDTDGDNVPDGTCNVGTGLCEGPNEPSVNRRDTDWYLISQAELTAADADGNGTVRLVSAPVGEAGLDLVTFFITVDDLVTCTATVQTNTGCYNASGQTAPDGVVAGTNAASEVFIISENPSGIIVFVSPGLCTGAGIFDGFECSTGINDYTVAISADPTFEDGTFTTCGDPENDPTLGPCNEPNPGVGGCEDPNCCKIVCGPGGFNPLCCQDAPLGWILQCAEAAVDLGCAPEPGGPICIYTHNYTDGTVDNELVVCTDPYGSWSSDTFGGEGAGDLAWGDDYNPVGADTNAEASFTNGFFIFDNANSQRELLSNIIDWQQAFTPDATLERTIIGDGSLFFDDSGDSLNDRLTSEFRVTGAGKDLTFELVQTISQISPAGGSTVAVVTQVYDITNNSGAATSFELVRHLDLDLVWNNGSTFADDSVGSSANGTPSTYVFQGEQGDDAGYVTVATDYVDINGGGEYYCSKSGIQPPGGGPANGAGTDTQQWDEYGVPTGWENYIPGLGYATNGESGPLPLGVGADGSVGISIPVNLAGAGPSSQAQVIVTTTYGADCPLGGVCGDVVLCPWDCEAVPDGAIGINDFLALLAQWTTVDSCDFDGGGVGINDFLDLLANWGPCP